ncbi:phosphoadenosine phosphosulfate reductase family protein [Burkholderia pseudomultivorans]|uniref:phosphoadenosine phosphosulfate reductase domain-containing protein n=1 Tax=Burkholderia pseudomultivorans TaxID=1207504 RepID=UPI00075E492A|nr:phosphoadenosine phosphosulfate reductase family protein [Burkholderia pseudomultivorans]KVC30705.1 methyltransferase type 11 [Burkholderia pseudomultivorans]KVC33951.1 methyltransferase type 11 [Burkholderia pseudomultivorans]
MNEREIESSLPAADAGDETIPVISSAAALSLFRYGEHSPYWDADIEVMRRKLLESGSVGAVSRMEFLVEVARKDIERAMTTHQRAALTFSGGKDSLACLYLLRPWWDRVIVLWANAGDPYPETIKQMERIRALVPNFVEVTGPGYIRGHGPEQTFPADMVPLSATPAGRMAEASAPRFKVHSKFDCCWSNWWLPLNNKVNELGIDLLVRGDREDEKLTNNAVLNATGNEGGGTYLLPLRHWSKEDVFAYLRTEGVEIPRSYEYGLGSLDCLHCTAWLNESGKKLQYLRDFHPEAAVEYEQRLRLIQSEQERHVRLMKIALGELEPIDGEGSGD